MDFVDMDDPGKSIDEKCNTGLGKTTIDFMVNESFGVIFSRKYTRLPVVDTDGANTDSPRLYL
jgi:hypothetical protein